MNLYRPHFLGAPTLTPYGKKVMSEYFTQALLKRAKASNMKNGVNL